MGEERWFIATDREDDFQYGPIFWWLGEFTDGAPVMGDAPARRHRFGDGSGVLETTAVQAKLIVNTFETREAADRALVEATARWGRHWWAVHRPGEAPSVGVAQRRPRPSA